MYKENLRVLSSNINYDENMLYSCKCDVHCLEGTFEKGSVVRIASNRVKRDTSSFEEEYIRLYDMDAALGNSSIEPYRLLWDIPIGVNADNFGDIFQEEEELVSNIANVCDKSDKWWHIGDILASINRVILTVAIIGTLLGALGLLAHHLFGNMDETAFAALVRLIGLSIGGMYVLCIGFTVSSAVFHNGANQMDNNGIREVYEDWLTEYKLKQLEEAKLKFKDESEEETNG